MFAFIKGVVNFDNVPEAAYFSPSLTTISQKFDQLGNLAINLMLSQLKEPGKRQTLMISPELISRESTQKKSVKKESRK